MRTVARLSVAPVKSLALDHPELVVLEPSGVSTNRRFHLVDARGRLYNGTRRGALVRVRSAWDPATEQLALTFPDGTTAEGDATDLGSAVRTEFYGRPVDGRVVEGPFGAALSAYAGARLRLVRTDRPGAGVDVWPLTLLSTASATELARRAGDPRPGDTARFRMLIEIAGCTAHEEDGWAGQPLRVGGAVVRVQGPVPRCAVTQQDPATGRHQFPTLRAITAYRGTAADGRSVVFGMYGEVLDPGPVRVGDPVEPLPPRP
ncbi:MAG TPA: MOSC N-terminal beta barrel domain-containing protein [Candidatus Dormibacteraeota bacterium]|nr:MOSC N-terminal beta barrel domain-containing protein [Candidatus Dormibacteraeota bacterium]